VTCTWRTDARDAVTRGDFDAVEAMLAHDVTFTSPVAFTPYKGRPVSAAILRAVSTVFEDVRYVREVFIADGHDAVLELEATVNGKQINGADVLRVNDDGADRELQSHGPTAIRRRPSPCRAHGSRVRRSDGPLNLVAARRRPVIAKERTGRDYRTDTVPRAHTLLSAHRPLACIVREIDG
jgi:hypothetical protein